MACLFSKGFQFSKPFVPCASQGERAPCCDGGPQEFQTKLWATEINLISKTCIVEPFATPPIFAQLANCFRKNFVLLWERLQNLPNFVELSSLYRLLGRLANGLLDIQRHEHKPSCLARCRAH